MKEDQNIKTSNIRLIVEEVKKSNYNIFRESYKFNYHDSIILNVRGIKYEVLKINLNKFPKTRLGRIVNDIEEKSEVQKVSYYEFYFDRDPYILKLILNYYITGKLHVSNTNCVNLFRDELAFWEIDEDYINICCKLKFFSTNF